MKMKELKITLSPTGKRDLQVNRVSKTRKQILEAIRKEVESAVEHFNLEDGGWKLNKDYIQSEVIRNILGFHIEDEILLTSRSSCDTFSIWRLQSLG